MMMKVKLPFEPSTLGAAAGLAAMRDDEFLSETVRLNRESLLYFHSEFERLGLRFIPSLANFVMLDLRTPERVDQLFNGLLKRGVITRPLEPFGLPNCLRISTGTMEQNRRCVAALEEMVTEMIG